MQLAPVDRVTTIDDLTLDPYPDLSPNARADPGGAGRLE